MTSGLPNFLFSWRRDSSYFLMLAQLFFFWGGGNLLQDEEDIGFAGEKKNSHQGRVTTVEAVTLTNMVGPYWNALGMPGTPA